MHGCCCFSSMPESLQLMDSMISSAPAPMESSRMYTSSWPPLRLCTPYLQSTEDINLRALMQDIPTYIFPWIFGVWFQFVEIEFLASLRFLTTICSSFSCIVLHHEWEFLLVKKHRFRFFIIFVKPLQSQWRFSSVQFSSTSVSGSCILNCFMSYLVFLLYTILQSLHFLLHFNAFYACKVTHNFGTCTLFRGSHKYTTLGPDCTLNLPQMCL